MLVIKKHTKIIKVAACFFIVASAIFLLANFVLAADPNLGLNFAEGTGLKNTTDIRVIIARIIRIGLGFLGIIALGLIIYAGFLWMTSGGDEEKIQQAKKILQNAVIGLIIILSAFAIASFILSRLIGGSGGPGNGPGDNPPAKYGLSALGNGIIESHYPARNQKEVPRNTSIIITFREPMKADTLCVNPDPQGQGKPDKCVGDIGTIKGDINTKVIGIFKKVDEDKCIADNLPLAGCPSIVGAEVYSTDDGKTFVFVPNSYLGSASEYIDYTVFLGKGLLRRSGELAFPGGFEKDYGWSFEVSNKIDLTPPQVRRNGVFPLPDDDKDTTVLGLGQQARGTITVNSMPSVSQPAKVIRVVQQGVSPLATAEVNSNCQREGYFIADIKEGPVATLSSIKKPPPCQNYGDVDNDGYVTDKDIILIRSHILGMTTLTPEQKIRADADKNGSLSVSDLVLIQRYILGISLTLSAVCPTRITQDEILNLGQGVFALKDGKKQAVFSECNLALTLSEDTANFTAGNSWFLTLNKATAADTITVGNITYTAVSGITAGTNYGVHKNDNITADNIRSVLNNNSETVIATRSGNVVTITATAKIAGTAGNNINLSSSNSEALEVSAMAGGTDRAETVTVNGRTDQPMNTAIQINFNEAIMPLTVSGSSDQVKDFIKVVNADPAAKAQGAVCSADKDCKSLSCISGICDGANEYLKGKFAVSNQYSTVEFLSDKVCGFNNCGEKIYCLPADSHLRVELKAASLISCADNAGNPDDSLCRTYSPFNICDSARKFCRDRDNKYFPQAAKDKPNIVDGLVDVAFNSLDGNRDGSAYGPASYYNENLPEDTDAQKLVKAAGGDNYKWSFFISSLLDLIPPKIKTTTPVINQSNVDLIEKITISFNKIMLSSRLTTGSLTIQNGQKNILHYLLNLRSLADQPLGYWVTNLGQLNSNGEMISTDAYLNHTQFSKASTYKAQAGSGLKDIYQNCFLPCSSLTNPGNPSCCNGVPYAQEKCP